MANKREGLRNRENEKSLPSFTSTLSFGMTRMHTFPLESPGLGYQYPTQDIQDQVRRKGARGQVRRGNLTCPGAVPWG